MGCVSTAPAKIEAYKPQTNAEQITLNHKSAISETIYQNKIERAFQQLIKDVVSISYIPDIVPVLCIGENTFPIVVEELYSEENEQINFDVPIVAASQYSKGKIVCLGTPYYFLPKYLKTDNTEELIVNCLRWVTPNHSADTLKSMDPDTAQNADNVKKRKTALLLGIPSQTIADSIITVLRKRRIISTSCCSELPSVIDYDYVFLSMSYKVTNPDFDETIINFVRDGGGLIVFAAPTPETMNYDLNSCLTEFGISYPQSNFIVGKQANHLFLSHTFDHVKYTNFDSIKESYISLLRQRLDIGLNEFDTTISVLHLYTSTMDPKKHKVQIAELYHETMSFLSETGYITENGQIAPNSLQMLAIVQLTSLIIKSPLIAKNGCPTIERFPGIPGPKEKPSNFTRTIKINGGQNGWLSTGFWLPPSQIGHVKVSKILPTMKIQIGCHQLELTAREGPYLRWPLIVSEVHFQSWSNELEIASPFGGFIYIVLEEESLEETEIEATFENVVEYPRICFNDPSVWEKTKSRDVQWGEIEADTIIFSDPRSVMDKLTDYDKFFDTYRTAINVMSDFFCVDVPSPVRIVYDCEVLPGSLYPKNYNPIFLNTRSVDDLLRFQEPSTQIFQIFKKIAMSLVFGDNLDHMTKKILSCTAAVCAITKIWPKHDPFMYTTNDSPMTKCLWDIIQQVGVEAIPRTIDQLRDILPEELSSPDDPWIAFVMLLSKNAGMNLTPVLQKVRPIPLNATLSVQQLPSC